MTDIIMKHTNINFNDKVERLNSVPEHLNAVGVHVVEAIKAVMTDGLKAVVIVSDEKSGHYVLAGSCCPACTANAVKSAMDCVEAMEKDGTITKDEPDDAA